MQRMGGGTKTTSMAEVGREAEVLQRLLEVTERLNQGDTLEACLSDIAQAAVAVSGGETCSVMLLEDDGEALLCRAGHGIAPDEAGRIQFQLGEGIAGWVAQHGKPVCLANAPADARFVHIKDGPTTIKSLCCVPMTTRDGVIGVITVTSPRLGALGGGTQQILAFLAATIVKDVENARLYRLAVTDVLTRLYNRQYLAERLPREIDRARRYREPLSVVLMDIDYFKKVNDAHGHAAGDDVLRALADHTRELVREVDTVVRYGGEEFLLLLPATGAEGAWRVADRIRERVQGLEVKTRDARIRFTVSAGVAELSVHDGGATDLIARADDALYAAKDAGRNRVVGAV